jgi:hypothetical protein
MNKCLLLIFLFSLAVFVVLAGGCTSPQERFDRQLDQAIGEEFSYSSFYNEGFSASYPVWPKTSDDTGSVELSVSRGYCSVTINSERLAAEQWFGMFMDSVQKQNGTIIESDDEEHHIKFSLPYQNLTLVSDNRIYYCNGNAIAITITCIEQAEEKMRGLHDEVFGSATCEEKEEPAVEEPVPQEPAEEGTEYDTLVDGDFSVEYPEWTELQDEAEQRVLGVSKGVCSVIVDKHNALPKDIYDWIKKAIEDNDEQDLLGSSADNDFFNIDYRLLFEGKPVTAKTRILYCNYQSYIVQVLCVDELMSEEYEVVRDTVLDSASCARTYEIPTHEAIEEKKEEITEEEPEVIDEIKDEIVRTHAGDEFGIDEEMVVYFINNNAFFGRIMRDFPKGNLVIEDKDNDRELRLRANIDDDGKITLLEDGNYDDADVTLIIPLRDALNIFSNAQNINPLTLLGFAVNVRTDPPDIKNEVIQKALRGEYND